MRKIVAIVLVFFFLVLGNVFASKSYQHPIFYGPTTQDDHLWRIAIKLKPSFLVNEDQVMLALLEYNPEAFDFKNINAIRPGHVLKLPSLDIIRGISPKFAYLEIKRQNEHWKELLEKQHKKKHKKLKKNRCLIKTAKQKEADTVKATEQNTAKQSAVGQVTQVQTSNYPTDQSSRPIIKLPETPIKQQAMQPMQQQVLPAQATDTRLNSLEEKHSTTQQQVNALNLQIAALQHEIHELKKLDKAQFQNVLSFKGIGTVIAQVQQKIGTVGFLIVVFFIFLFITFFVRGLFARSGKKKPEVPVINPPKDDYDFMSSKESNPSKLNLAHAYIEMGNIKAAREVLNEVYSHGDPDQQSEAKALLDKLPK